MRVIAGPEKKSRILAEKERVVTAYHEMGHALVGHFLPNADPVHKISIVSRGQALGYTISMPDEDKFLTTKGPARGHHGHDPGRPGGRGARLRRDHHRRRQRPREGDRHRQADDDALWHVRQARPAGAGPQPGRALPGPRHALRARLLGRHGPHHRLGDPAHHRGGPPARARHPGRAPRRPGDPRRRSCCAARRSSARSSWPCWRAPPRRASLPSATAARPSSRPRPSARRPTRRPRASACPTRPPATPSPRARSRGAGWPAGWSLPAPAPAQPVRRSAGGPGPGPGGAHERPQEAPSAIGAELPGG